MSAPRPPTSPSGKGQNKTRYILKQVRPLEPSPEVPDAVRSFPIPHDILARARRIERHHCTGEPVTLSWLQVFTDPNCAPDLGFSQQAFAAEISGRLAAPQGATAFSQTHLDALELRSTANGITARLAVPSPWFQIQVERNQATLTPSVGTDVHIPLNCQVSIEYAEPEAMLRAFLESGAQENGAQENGAQ